MQAKRQVFASFITANGNTATKIFAQIPPKTPLDLRAAIGQVMSGQVHYFVNPFFNPQTGAKCQCVVNHIAIFFNEGPNASFELIDAEYAP